MRLPGNLLPGATAANDRGPAPDDLPLSNMLLVLRRAPLQDLALRQELDAQREAGSPEFHRWLTPAQFGQRFGPAPSDLAAVEAWLRRSGFTIARVAAGGGVIEFSGTAGQVAASLHTPIHRFRMSDGLHWANLENPAIPAALIPVVAGVVSLNDRRKSAGHIVGRGQVSAPGADALVPLLNFTDNGVVGHALAPGDFATIYNLNPAYAQNLSGQGQSIAIVARSDVSSGDVQSFRQLFLAPAVAGNLPRVIVAGTDPGFANNDDTAEATLDVEWAGAVAPQAQIDLVVAASTAATDGVDLAAEFIVDHDLAPVMSTSFGQCEASLGAAENTFWNALWEQAAAEGISAFVSAGDSGSAGCDPATATVATHGLAVSGLASTPFATAVGGTEFSEGGGAFWSSSTTASQFFATALGYIPEHPWNESGLQPQGQNLWSGGGGVSALYPKPVWQAGAGVPADGQRDLPDLSLAAAGHDGYVVCLNASCSGSPTSFDFFIFSGTSASSPSLAGVMALVDQKMGAPQGLANPFFYQLAAQQNQSSPGACLASGPPGASCTILDITSGNNIVPCLSGGPDCPNGSLGFAAAPGYDLTTGLGSVNATNLINNWSNVKFAPSSTTLTAPASFTVGQSLPVTIQVAAAGTGASAIPSGDVELLAENAGTVTPVQLVHLSSGGAASLNTAAFPAGTYNLVARYAGDLTFGSSLSPPLSLTVAKVATTLQLSLFEKNSAGAPVALTPGSTVPFGAAVFATMNLTTATNSSVAGPVVLANNGVGFTATYLQSFSLTNGSATTPTPVVLNGGSDIYTASFAGDANDMAATPASVSFQVTKATTTLALSVPNPADGTVFAILHTSAGVGALPQTQVEVLDAGTPVAIIPILTSMADPATGDLVFNGQTQLGTLPPGPTATLTATFAGDANYLPSSAAPLAITTPPQLKVAPFEIDFPTTVVGSVSAPQTFTISNLGGSALPGLGLSFQTPIFTETDNCGSGVPAGGSCSVQVRFAPNQPGSQSSVLISVGFGVLGFVTGPASGIDLASATFSQGTADGQSATYALTLTPVNGFTGPASLSCTNLPPAAACSFAPASVNLDGVNPAAVTLTISTTAPASGGSGDFPPLPPWPWWVEILASLGLLLGWRRMRRPPRPVPIAALLALAIASVACGGGGGGAPPVNPVPATPSAPYRIDPTQLPSFGSVSVGTSSSEILNVVAGPNSVPAPALAITQTGFPKPDFSASDSCSGTVPAFQTCHIQITFTPTLLASESAQLSLDNGQVVPMLALTGVGVPPRTPLGVFNINVNATSGTATATTEIQLSVH